MTRVDYDEAVRSYEARLDTKLRDFAADAIFARWVPDPDPMRGVLNLLEAALEAEVRELEIVLSDATAARLDLDELRAAAPGEIALEQGVLRATLRERARGDGEVRRPGPRPARPAEPERVKPGSEPLHASFVKRARARDIGWRRELEDGARRTDVMGATLWIVADELVKRAGHAGAQGDLEPVLDVWCELVEGLPTTEAIEHGVHRAMDRLRDPGAAPPVPGVVTPRNASPVFAALLEASWRLGGGVEPDSRWAPEPSERWKSLGDEARLDEVRRALAEACRALGVEVGHVEAAGLRDATKVRLDFADEVPIAQRRDLLLTLERALQDNLEPTLVVEREARRDLNVLRRL